MPGTLSKDVAAGRESSEGRRLLVFDLERHLAVDRAGGNILNLMRGNGGLEIELVGRRRNAVAEIRFYNDRGALRELQLLLALFVPNAEPTPRAALPPSSVMPSMPVSFGLASTRESLARTALP